MHCHFRNPVSTEVVCFEIVLVADELQIAE
jgi:hypothetical protein